MTAAAGRPVSEVEDQGSREPGFLFGWQRLIGLARIPSSVKLVAHTLITFADGNGTSVRPSVARLVVLTGYSYATVKRGRAVLIRSGLMVLVRRGNRRRGQADEYRLIIPEDIDERLHWLSPADVIEATKQVAARHRGDDNDPVNQGSPVSPRTRSKAHPRSVEHVSGLTHEPPPTHKNKTPAPHRDQPISDPAQPDTPTAPAATKPDPPIRAHQLTLGPDCQACGTALDPDGTCFRCPHP